MKPSFYIAKRYFFSKKSRLINWISGISTIGIAVGSAALIIVLSVFNGLSALVENLYNSFDSDLKIESVSGKYFQEELINLEDLRQIDGVDACIPVLEESILVKYGKNQQIATIKGVGQGLETKLNSILIKGDYKLMEHTTNYVLPYAIIGYGVFLNLGISLESPQALGFYVPSRGKTLNITSPDALREAHAIPSAVFSAILDYDDTYVLTDINFAKGLIDTENEISAVELLIHDQSKINAIRKQVQKALGPDFTVKNQMQQHEMYFKTVQSERFVTVLILSFILLIATFNMIASLMMIIYDKRKDIAILKSMGADLSLIRKIFLYQGLLMASVGGLIGLFLGGLIAWLQQHFGFIKLGQGDGFIVNAYPVQIHLDNFLLVLCIVLFVALLSSSIPILNLGKKRE